MEATTEAVPKQRSTGGRAAFRGWALRTAPALVPAGLLVILWTLWTANQGGYFPNAWLPGAVGMLLLVVVVAIARRQVLPVDTAARLALLLFAAFVLWSYASMLWSGSPASAWEASNKLLLFLLSAWLVSILPWTTASLSIFLGVWSLAVTGVCAASLIAAVGAPDLGEFFIQDRYFHPIGYVNGVSAIAVMASWPAVWLATSRQTPAPLQVLFAAASVYLLCFSLLPQSRGAVLGAVVGLAVMLALAPDRLRLLALLVIVGGATALAVGDVYQVYDVRERLAEGLPAEPLAPVLEDAAGAIVRSVLLAAAAAAALVAFERLLLERRLRPAPHVGRAVRVGVAGLFALVALAGLVVALANAGQIRRELNDRWDVFSSGEEIPTGRGPRLTVSGSDQRNDYWRVALEAFGDEPLTGIGAGNFQVRYSADREDAKPSRYTHDIWLRFLSEGGLVGIGLFVSTLIALVGACARVYRRSQAVGRGLVAVAAAVLSYFLAHASFDWLEEFPALAAPALAFPFCVLGLPGGKRPERPSHARRPSAMRKATLAGLSLLGAAGFVSLAMPWFSVRYTERAEAGWRSDADAAYRDLERAAAWNPLSPQPALSEGTIALYRGDERRAKVAFQRSVEVEETWYARLELALIEASARRFGAAERELRRARRLNAVDPSLSRLKRLIAARRRVRVSRFNRRIVRETGDRFTRPER